MLELAPTELRGPNEGGMSIVMSCCQLSWVVVIWIHNRIIDMYIYIYVQYIFFLLLLSYWNKEHETWGDVSPSHKIPSGKLHEYDHGLWHGMNIVPKWKPFDTGNVWMTQRSSCILDLYAFFSQLTCRPSLSFSSGSWLSSKVFESIQDAWYTVWLRLYWSHLDLAPMICNK